MAITRNGGSAVVPATTTRAGITQLTDSTSSTSTTTAATPNSVKTAYDLADAAIPKSLVDAAGDLIVGTADNVVGRVALGASGTRLTSNGSAPVWVADSTNTVVDAAGDLLIGTGADTLGRLAIGTSGYLLTSNGTTATWAVAPTSGLTANDANLAFAVQVFA